VRRTTGGRQRPGGRCGTGAAQIELEEARPSASAEINTLICGWFSACARGAVALASFTLLWHSACMVFAGAQHVCWLCKWQQAHRVAQGENPLTANATISISCTPRRIPAL